MPKTFPMHDRLLLAFHQAEEVYDSALAGHTHRVSDIATRIGKRLGMSSAELKDLSWIATLHDIGKLGVAQEIIQKTGSLTEVEWIEMRQHPLIGEAIILAISPAFEEIGRGVRGHHERWDGLGYPDAIGGDQIPLMSRVVAISDSYDALRTVRTYRSGVSTDEEALRSIVLGADSHYDASLVEVFGRVVTDDSD